MADKEPAVFTGPTDKHSNNDEESDSEEGNGKGIAGIYSNFSVKTSLSGMPFIVGAENKNVKIIWSLLLFAAFGLMVFHLCHLASTFFEFKKQTEVQLSYSNLEFPAVTICNVNPMRMSQVNLTSLELSDFIDSVDPYAVRKLLDDWTPELEDIDDDEGDGNVLENRKKRKKRETETTDKRRHLVRTNNFIDDINLAQNNTAKQATDEYFSNNEQRTWEAESSSSGFYAMHQKFMRLFTAETSSTRSKLGHQVDHMLIQCSFAGRKCMASNFTRSQSAQFGNCYTLQYHKFVSRKSGPSEGLQLQLFLETDDYVPGIANSKGVQVIIHDQKTLPFPEDDGLAVAAGTETFIGIRRVEISRLGLPYGQCTPIEGFQKKYGVKYTRKTCQRICQQERTRLKCNCYDNVQQEVNRVLKKRRKLRACRSNTEIKCALRVASDFQNDSDVCDCYKPCSETTFDRTISSRNWPNPAYATLLSSAVCKQNISVCATLPDKKDMELREEFTKVVIYYEDLNYENLEESEDYKIEQFLSDVGGTIGLWIGLSLLSLCEIFHLITALFLYICCAKGRQRKWSLPHAEGGETVAK